MIVKVDVKCSTLKVAVQKFYINRIHGEVQEFLEKSIMPNGVEGLLDVQENCQSVLLSPKGFLYEEG